MMVDLVEPVARLRAVFDGLERLSVRHEHKVRGLETALCHLQFAIDLLEDAQSADA